MKLFVTPHNNRFIKNIVLNKLEGLEILSGDYKHQLYKIHQQHQIHSYIFISTELDSETTQFISDYCSKIKIFIYHNSYNDSLVKQFPNCYHLCHDSSSLHNVISIPRLVNTDIFFNMNSQNRSKGCFISFIDDIDIISKKLSHLLYPNTKFKIKIYGDSFGHYQNLGKVSEQDKADILNRNKNFLAVNDDYIEEALLCGCDIYTVDSIQDNKIINDTISVNYETYIEFLHNILI